MQYNRDPPPYPGHLKQQQLYQPGFRQSYSGSETSTDVSMSSTENLSLQARQDPQGEETDQITHQLEYVELDSNSILARLGMPAVEVKSTNSGTFYVTGSMQQPNVMKSYVLNNHQNSPTPVRPYQFQDTSSLYASQKLAHLYKCVEKNQTQQQNQNLAQPNYQNDQPYITNGFGNCTVAGLTSSCVTGAPDFSYLPPPPEYPGHKQLTAEQVDRLHRSYELLSGEKSQNSSTSSTRSQPDLTRVTEGQAIKLVNIGQSEADTSFDDKELQLLKGTFTSSGTTSTTSTISKKPPSDIDHALVAARASQLVERLSEENTALREELDGYYKKVSKLQKFELEIQKVHESHESLVRSSKKRESLEATMRLKLENECKKLKDVNKDLKDQLEKALSQPMTCNGSLKDSDLRKEVSKKDAIIAKLIAQNKELVSGKERLEIELSAQRSTLQEQRTHIDVLDNALTNAQANVVRLEDECRKKDMYVERVEHLQNSLASLQRVCGNREQLQEKLTTKLHHEIHTLRAQKKSKSGELPKEENAELTVDDLKQLLSEKEEKILTLESDVITWEQRYLEENALRQLAFDAASQPREARIAALEQNSAESERLIAEARTEKMKHIEEVYQAQRKSAEMETRLKSLQAQLAEKEAMIRVLQKHSFSSSNTSITMFNTPLHSPRPSYTMPINTSTMLSSHSSHSHNDVTTTSRDVSLASHSKSNSAGEVEKRNFRPSHAHDNVSLQQLLFEKKFDADKVSTCLWQV
ncbi:angiomotin-like isoform X2 [Lineus longissimus]|uniref:angiomotin-like isoform X2 n=1 Tax=Lineus longissimus TaxID=88925 RepID=UPI00315D8FB0